MSHFQPMSALMHDLLNCVVAKAEIPNLTISAPLGFPFLDATNLDFQRGEVVLSTTKSSEEKTSVMINTILQIGKNPASPSLCFGGWANLNDMAISLVSAVGRIDQAALNTGVMTDSDWPHLTEAVEQLRHLPLFIFTGGAITLPKLISAADTFYREVGRIGQIVVDGSCFEGQQEKNSTNIVSLSIGEWRSFTEFAKKLKCSIVVICASMPELECKTGHEFIGKGTADTIESNTSTYPFRSERAK